LQTGKIRSFIAFDLSDEQILEKISSVQTKLNEAGADLRLVKPQNIHITLRFLGEVPAEIIKNVTEEMEYVKAPSFEVVLRGVGTFPSIKYPRVIWVGIEKGSDEAKEIHSQLEPRLRKIGLIPDKKGFSPHLTIARVRSGRNRSELVNILNELKEYDFGVIQAEFLRLKRSTLKPDGPIYSTIHEIKLAHAR